MSKTILETSAGKVLVQVRTDLPDSFAGFVVPASGGLQYYIAINGNRTDQEQRQTFFHEITHILKGHVSKGKWAPSMEREADAEAADLMQLYSAGKGQDREEIQLFEQWAEQRANREKAAF